MLIAAFDAGGSWSGIRHLAPAGAEIVTLDGATARGDADQRARYLDRLNFATNFVFSARRAFDAADDRELLGRLWRGTVRLWLRLFDAAGEVLAEWEDAVPAGAGWVRAG